ncbi:zinc finger protein 668-like [Aricia agestis]|uniref:zinc finger protein 668-like n=1 Tax=Aricia agestis TaxID=91739 RepID=UPI001C2040FE|nr:zinc finger protein 668-like [Aricia agestis]
MSSTMIKQEGIGESCCICTGGGDLLTPEEHDAGAPPLQVPLRTMLLHLNNNKVLPEGKLCAGCIRRAIESYEFSTALGQTHQPLSEKIRALRKKLYELTQKIDVFIVVGGPGTGSNSRGSYNEDDIIVVNKDALAAATAADDEESERARNARGDAVFQCSVCPQSFALASEYREHLASHPEDAKHSCWTCGAQFASKDALQDHSINHMTPMDLICQLCSIEFQSAAALRRHSVSCAARCPGCGAAAAGRAALAEHVRAAHAHAPPYVCAECFRPAPSADSLAAHALAHRRAERFVCGYDACVLRFPARADLLRHIRAAHAAVAAPPPPATAPAPAAPPPAPVPCDFCDRTFATAAAMKRHCRVHVKVNADESEWREAGGARAAVPAEGAAGEGQEMAVGDEGEEMAVGDEEEVEYLEMEVLDGDVS